MKCDYCGCSLALTDNNFRSFRLDSKWVNYHIYCFEKIIQEPKKPSPYKSINSSSCITIPRKNLSEL